MNFEFVLKKTTANYAYTNAMYNVHKILYCLFLNTTYLLEQQGE